MLTTYPQRPFALGTSTWHSFATAHVFIKANEKTKSPLQIYCGAERWTCVEVCMEFLISATKSPCDRIDFHIVWHALRLYRKFSLISRIQSRCTRTEAPVFWCVRNLNLVCPRRANTMFNVKWVPASDAQVSVLCLFCSSSDSLRIDRT